MYAFPMHVFHHQKTAFLTLPRCLCKIEWIKGITPYTFLVKCKVSYEVISISLGKTEGVFLVFNKITRTFLHIYVYALFFSPTIWTCKARLCVCQDLSQGTTRGLNATVLCFNGKIICCCYGVLVSASKGKLCLFLSFTYPSTPMPLTGV